MQTIIGSATAELKHQRGAYTPLVVTADFGRDEMILLTTGTYSLNANRNYNRAIQIP
ncbi:hypothetical protein SH449x_003891 [Pirellulaceae bacterium SH449]